MKSALLPILIALTIPLSAEVLYSTDFEDFLIGDDQWSANSNWATDNSNGGVDFIDDSAFNQALGKTAGLGLEQPSRTRARLLTPISHDASTTGESIITIETLISIKDSTNDFRDDFFLTFRSGNTLLASIRFDNQDQTDPDSEFGFWRENGTNQFDTGFDFIHEELYDLFITIDVEQNVWSCLANGNPLFENEQFTNTGVATPIDIGAIGYEWDLTSPTTTNHGNNFLLVADLTVSAESPDQAPELALTANDSGELELSWTGFAGKSYQLEYSSDLEGEIWTRDLPNSTFTTTDLRRTFTYRVDPAKSGKRFYRLAQMSL